MDSHAEKLEAAKINQETRNGSLQNCQPISIVSEIKKDGNETDISSTTSSLVIDLPDPYPSAEGASPIFKFFPVLTCSPVHNSNSPTGIETVKSAVPIEQKSAVAATINTTSTPPKDIMKESQ